MPLTIQLVEAINTGAFSEAPEFFTHAFENEYMDLSHTNFFYTYPAWGKKLPDGKPCQFHRFEVRCHSCGAMPERNYAGIGGIYLLKKNGRVLFTCKAHLNNARPFKPIKGIKFENNQLSLF